MKKFLIILAITVWNTGIYAQSTFTEAMFTDMMSRLQNDPNFFKNEVDASLTLTFGSGGKATQESMLKFAENNMGLYKRKETNLKVSQVGNTAMVTGVVEEQHFTKDKPNIPPRLYKGVFTYTFAKVKGKWLWVAGQHTDFRDTKEVDEAAIKKMLEAETMASDAADYKTYLSHYSKTNYTSFLYSGGLFVGDDLWKKLDEVFATRKARKISRTRSNWNIRINGSSAFVTYNQANENAETNTKNDTYEERYLEKISGEWKIVNVTVNSKSNPAFTAATLKEIFDEYKNDSKGFMNNRLSEDFRFTNPKGNYQPQKDFLGGTAQSIVSAEMLQPVIFQSGDLAVTSGIHHNVLTNKEGNQYTRDVAATYTWQRRNGKWMFVGSQQNNITAPAAEDEAAIKNTIEGETNAFKLNDESKTTGYWLNAPYTSHSYTAKGVGYVRGEKVGETITNYLKSNPKIDKSPTNYHDYIIRINGNSAWATWIAEGTSNGKKVSYYKGSYLEKVNGEWKIGSINSVEAK